MSDFDTTVGWAAFLFFCSMLVVGLVACIVYFEWKAVVVIAVTLVWLGAIWLGAIAITHLDKDRRERLHRRRR